ncbi:hypothetical protein L2E82_39472 [Cichorium intybus]|uniref:Uncharacterized protein n=1 Tax=Cichorium intybus TaxID=13427 RepID=A0ACB9AJM3_CICIN|nr:hypothetical protein L2E82_39472 [Cichorium intybus]
MSQPSPQPQSVSPEIVQDTQEEDDNQTRRAARKKGKKPVGEKQINWSIEEELNLMKAYISISVDPIVGDSQTQDTFWSKVQAIFYDLMGEKTRNMDKITGKFREMRLKLNQFNGIYNDLKNVRKSWSSDFEDFNAALQQYEKTTPTRKAIPYIQAWTELKKQPKWLLVEDSQSSGTKRSRSVHQGTSQQSDRRTYIDINDEPVDLEEDEPQLIRRPMWRDKAKKAASGSESSVMDLFGDKFDRYVQLQSDKVGIMSRVEQQIVETQQQIAETQRELQRNADIDLLSKKATEFEGEDLDIFLAMRESVRAKYRRNNN